MLDLADLGAGNEFLRPLTQGWMAKIEGALHAPARKRWKEVGSECIMFYNKSAAAMWDGDFTKKFWRGVKAPRFRVTINKAFEYIAVIGPNLIWDTPHRKATPARILEIPPQLIESDPQMYQQLQMMGQMEQGRDQLISRLMEGWLNYTPREMPEGGLEWHNEMAVMDAMLLGHGALWPSIYNFPASDRTLTGCFRKSPEDIIYDADFKTAGQCKWMALRHVEPHYEVERRFKLPPNSLKGKASLESSWHFSETQGQAGRATSDRQAGKTNDLVVWYEIWSRLGVGSRMTGMPDFLKTTLEETVGDYAYICVCPDCPYPLNCPSDLIRKGATPEQVRECFEWPVPWWTDKRWPYESLIFYEDPDSPYGVPPLAPALGELKAINAIVSWLVNRTWQSSRQMWAVLGQYYDDMKKVLDEGDDLGVFALPPGAGDDIRKVLQLIEQKEVNGDAWQVLQLLSDAFDKRTGLTEVGAYGTSNTQSRTAEDVKAKQKAFGIRPEFMQKKVVAWQGRAASMEAMLSWMFVKAKDVTPLFGQGGATLWQKFIEDADHEQVVRQMRFQIEAASVRRPNRDRDIENFQEYMGRWLPVMSDYGKTTGDFTPVNGAMKRWCELHDMERPEELFIPEKDPNDPNAQLQQQMQQAELQKTQAEAQKLMAEAQANPMAELQMEQQQEQQKLALEAHFQEREAQMDLEKTKMEIMMEIEKLKAELAIKQQELQMKAQEHQMDMAFKAQQSQVDLAVKKEQGAQQIAQGRQQMQLQKQQGEQALRHNEVAHKQQIQQGAATTKSKVDATKKISDARAVAAKSQASVKKVL